MKLKSQELPRILILIVVLFNFSCSIKSESVVDSPSTSETVSNNQQDRDLTKYDKGGIFNCGSYASNPDCDRKKFNQFIWQHWTEKKLGYLEANYKSTPDASIDVKIFIEPNKKGQWHIFWQESESYFSGGGPKNNSQEFLITSVEKVENKENKDDWTLLLKDSSGKVVQGWTTSY